MKQHTFIYTTRENFIDDLLLFRNQFGSAALPRMFFQIYSSILEKETLEQVWTAIEDVFPGIPWFGNSTSGNIQNCEMVEEILVTAQFFELSTTKFCFYQYDLSEITLEQAASQILREASACPWLKAVELYCTIMNRSTTALCDGLQNLDMNIRVFGGIVCSNDISSTDSCVYSSEKGYFKNGVLVLFYGGSEFYVDSLKISGWKPIGRNFLVTKSVGSRLYELGGIPAYEIYKKYLNIKNDDYFFYNAIDFPMMYEHNNTTIVRAPGSSNEDGSLNMSSDVEVGEILRLSYGDPQTILSSIRAELDRLSRFRPDIMHIVSCAARKAYWAPYEPTFEIQPLKEIAPLTGFFSHGEFIREREYVNQHNITLVIAAMREGPAGTEHEPASEDPSFASVRLPLAARMATFIRETSFELEEINSKLQVLNQQLEGLASTDSLTGLENRLAFDELLKKIRLEDDSRQNWVMLMMDVNGLKYTNDTFGHLAGDELIIGAAKIIDEVYGTEGHSYRIGGDEFAVVIDAPVEMMSRLNNEFRTKIIASNKNSLYHLSIAVGESRLKDAAGIIKSISDWKLEADLNMYRDKANAHRRAVRTETQNNEELIRCLITIQEAKDPYTANHSDRVSDLSVVIARMLGLTEGTVQIIKDAAHLHDIGKVGISDSILSKPAILSDEEFEIIKRHPVIGARILMQSNYTQELVQIVLHHHERYDGKGYPDNLEGDSIPVGARIVSLADSIDAMTSRRVYRDGLSLQYCRLEIEHNLGRIYDPAIGRMVLNRWSEIEDLLLLHPKRLM